MVRPIGVLVAASLVISLRSFAADAADEEPRRAGSMDTVRVTADRETAVPENTPSPAFGISNVCAAVQASPSPCSGDIA